MRWHSEELRWDPAREKLVKIAFPPFWNPSESSWFTGILALQNPKSRNPLPAAWFMVLLMILLHKVSVKGYWRQSALCWTTSTACSAHICLCTSPFSGPHSTRILPSLSSLSLALLSVCDIPDLWQLLTPWVRLFATYLLSSCFLLTGYHDCVRSVLRETGTQPLPSIPEVRQLVALYGILPLGKSTPEGKNTPQGFASWQKNAFYCLWQGLISRDVKHFAA